MLAVVCPGQGAQSPGLLSAWLELPGTAELLGGWSERIGIDLAKHGTESDAETIRDTAIAQPLLTATALATARHALDPDGPGPDVLAGHSVGEFPAAVLAGVLRAEDAVSLVATRGAAMARAAAQTPTGMSAILGGDAEEVLARLAELELTAANVNGGGQVVAAGALEPLAALAANPPARARVIALQVAGAFHTAFMSPAVAELAAAAREISVREPTVTLVSNADGALVGTGTEALDRLVAQVANPVRWDLCCERLLALGVTGLLELSPAGVLTGLARRTLPGVATVALKSPDDLGAARDLIREHAGTTASKEDK